MSILCDGSDVNSLIDEFGDTVTVRSVTISSTDEYGDATETTSDAENVPTIMQSYSAIDQDVKEGIFDAGQIVFTFKNDRTDISAGNRIYHSSLWYQIKEVRKASASDTTYLLQAVAERI